MHTIPLLSLTLIVTYAVVNWTVMARATRYNEATTPHSDRIYKLFELYVKINLALAAALGYVRFQYFDRDHTLARQGMLWLGIVAIATMTVLVVLVATHQGSKIRRWKRPFEWHFIPLWLETWMMLGMYGLAVVIWYAANLW